MPPPVVIKPAQSGETAAYVPAAMPLDRRNYVVKRIGAVLVSREMVRAGQVAPSPVNSFFTLRGQLRSLAFGLACGGAVILVSLFILFNELVITPFIQPSRSVAQVPAVDPAGVPVDPSPKIRIPKINVDIPVVYGLQSTDEKEVALALDKGVVHYPTTVLPGKAGNAVYFGHSSNNIFNPGKYKFAFVLLHQLALQDMFYLTHDSKLYTYEVISRRVVKPTEVGVLGPVAGQTATATLITCDPPGTSNNRLVVVGRQISPGLDGTDVLVVPDEQAAAENAAPKDLPGNGPGLLRRILSGDY
jgi:sortase A